MVRTKYRSSLQIIADILLITENSAKKTHILYKANLSYKLLCIYLSKMLDAELICYDNGSSYDITEKGRRFLKKFNDYSQRRRTLQEHVEAVNNDKLFLENMV